jgi:hypothetical protein
VKAGRTIVVAKSIFVVMECGPQNGERKTNKQQYGKSFHSLKSYPMRMMK